MKAATKARAAFAACLVLTLSGLALALSLLEFSETAGRVDPSPVASIEQEADDPFPAVDWDYWKSQNPDVIGWITVPGTGIDLPICQAPASDPTYYLSHDVYRKWNFYGCPYLDADCAEKGFDSPLAMVFGHHMSDGSIFAEMASYSDKAFAQDHCEILLQTPEEKKRLHVAAADVVDTYNEFKRLGFGDRRDFLAWWGTRSRVQTRCSTRMRPDPESVHAFVTCSYGLWNGHERTIVYAVE